MVTAERDEDIPWSLPLLAELHSGRSCVPKVEPEGASHGNGIFFFPDSQQILQMELLKGLTPENV